MASSVRQWLQDLGLGQYADAFEANELDTSHLPDLSEDDLRELGVEAMGHRKTIMRAIPGIAESEDRDEATPVAAPQPSPEAERRQLSVMFVDMVGSTALSARLDPEDLRQIMGRFQDAVTDAITRYGGHVAKYLGDGVLAYFGWPMAYEDQAERAICAGLESVQAVNAVSSPDGGSLQARVGIATGQVVVGDLVGVSGRDVEAVIGETPNLAARLEQLAAPGQVVVCDATCRLVGQMFDMGDLGEQRLKGFEQAVRAWNVIGELSAESRFEATRGQVHLPMIGRDTELQLLLDRWQLAAGGEGQAVLISGEAGIGKSRLLQGLTERIADSDHVRIRYQCSPYHSNSALYPTIQQLEQALDIAPNDSDDARLDKLEALLSQAGESLVADAPLFADLLSLAGGARYEPLTLQSEQKMERLLEALTAQLLGLAEHQPVLFLVEDVHWIDPTSQKLLQQIVGRIQNTRVLMVGTHRPEWQMPGSGHTLVTSLHLNRLGRGHIADIVRAVAGSKGDGVADDVIARVAERTDGVPLFVEELTRSLIEGGQDIADADIPATLQSLLTERLDRLGGAKETAQIGAVVGREISHDLLAAVADKSGAELGAAVDVLVRSGLMFQRGEAPNAVYSFKHALVRDTAYESLLFASRRDWHLRIGNILETRFPETAKAQPELVAHHFTEGNQLERAIPHWLNAGQRAAERSAGAEAIAHLTRGLSLVGTLPEGPERDLQELRLKIVLGPILLSVRGFGDPEARKIYQQAMGLSERVGDPDQQFAAMWGLWLCNATSDGYAEASKLSVKLIDLGNRQGDADQILQAHHAAWTTDLMGGRYAACWDRAGEGIGLYDPEKHVAHKFTYGGHDPGVCARNHGSSALWTLGKPDQALATSEDAVALARRIEHPNSLIQALTYRGSVRIRRGELDAAMQSLEEAMALSTHRKIVTWGAFNAILSGWVAVNTGALTEGVEQMRRGMEDLRKVGNKTLQLRFLPLVSEAFTMSGAHDEALAILDEAQQIFEQIDARDQASEVHRVRGNVLLNRSAESAAEAIAQYQTAMTIAASQKAKSYELLAAMELARLWSDTGRYEDARSLLTPVYEGFSEGLETENLRQAKSILDELPASS